MKVIKKLSLLAIFAITSIAYGAEQSQAESKQDAEKQVTENDEHTIFVSGVACIIPSMPARVCDWNELIQFQIEPVKKIWPDLTPNDILIEMQYSPLGYKPDWTSTDHPYANTRFCNYLPVEKPILNTVHPDHLRPEVQSSLEAIIPAGVINIINGYAENPHSIVQCKNGDVIEFEVPNIKKKKIIGRFQCVPYYGPFEMSCASALLRMQYLSIALKEEMNARVTAYEKNENTKGERA